MKEHYFVDDGMVEAPDLDPATEMLLDFFDEVGYLVRSGAIGVERVWAGWPALPIAWATWEPTIKKVREEWGTLPRYQDLEYLRNQLVDFERQRGVVYEPPTIEELREFIDENLQYVEVEKPPASEDDSTRG